MRCQRCDINNSDSDLDGLCSACRGQSRLEDELLVAARARTKRRETMAVAIMAGLVSNPAIGPYRDEQAASYAISAVNCANALMDRLDDQEGR